MKCVRDESSSSAMLCVAISMMSIWEVGEYYLWTWKCVRVKKKLHYFGGVRFEVFIVKDALGIYLWPRNVSETKKLQHSVLNQNLSCGMCWRILPLIMNCIRDKSISNIIDNLHRIFSVDVTLGGLSRTTKSVSDLSRIFVNTCQMGTLTAASGPKKKIASV